MLMLAILLAQFTFFYRHELAQLAELRPILVELCQLVGCELTAAAPAATPELLQTTIAPHPRYANALRIRSALVNRTDEVQPLPRLEVSLTDNDGRVLARRTFESREYLEKAKAAEKTLAPNVVVYTLLEITNPDGKAAGYEVRVLPPSSDS